MLVVVCCLLLTALWSVLCVVSCLWLVFLFVVGDIADVV